MWGITPASSWSHPEWDADLPGVPKKKKKRSEKASVSLRPGCVLYPQILSLKGKFFSEIWVRRSQGKIFQSLVRYYVISLWRSVGSVIYFCYRAKYSLEPPHLFLMCIIICGALPNDVQQPHGSATEPVAFTVTSAADTQIDIQGMLICPESLAVGCFSFYCGSPVHWIFFFCTHYELMFKLWGEDHF